MGLTKDYLLQIQQGCSEELFGQEAIEWAVYAGRVKLTGDLQTDLTLIMGAPNICPGCQHLEVPDSLKCDECGIDLHPNPRGQYDDLIEAYRAATRDHGRSLAAVYRATGFLDEILKPQPLLPPLPATKAVVA